MTSSAPRRPAPIEGRGTTRILVSQDVDRLSLASGTARVVPLARSLEQLGARVVDQIAGPGFETASEADPDLVVVAEVTPEAEARIRAAAPPNVHVERSQPLGYGFDAPAAHLLDPGLVPLSSGGFTTRVAVTGRAGAGVPDVEVVALGALWTHRAITGADGICELEVFGDTPETIGALIARPHRDHWSRYVEAPVLRPGGLHEVRLHGIAESVEGGGDRPGWGLAALGMDGLAPGLDGRGVRVAVIDSGIDGTHRELSAIAMGETVVGADPEGWRSDAVGHGSHVTGTIAAATDSNGIRSVAPGAEIVVIKLFPGGQTPELVRAINRAVSLGVDVVNLSLGMPGDSPAVAASVRQAHEAGIAVVAAAGNSAGPVMFPARMAEVLAVSAFGKAGTFPPTSYHAQQVPTGPAGLPEQPTEEGYFFAKFSCTGPEIDVTGPGVAVVSCAPGDAHQAMDGTSMACPHIAGLAALVLAARPELSREALGGAARVDTLFSLIRSSARADPALGGPDRIGAGIPDASALVAMVG